MERVLKTWPRSLALLICLLAAAGPALATTVVTPSDDDLIIGARAIVRAKVLSIESGFDEQHTSIYTYITLKVQEVLKGEITERRIVIKELGGQVGDRISVIYGNPHFTRGERVLLYLDTWKDGSLRTYQMFLGKFSVVKDPKTGHEFAVRDSGDENVVVLPASVGAPRAASTDRMELSSYLGMVRERLAANIERSRTFEETYYHDIPRLAAPPDYHKGRGDIQPLFTLISPSNPARWPEPDTNDPVPYTVNPDGAPNSQIVNDVAAAASAWSVVPGCALRVSYSGNLDQCYTGTGSPGINVVFNNCDGRNSPSPTCANILAWGGYSGARFAPKVVSGTTFNFEITQGFISFNPYASCNFGNSCIVREITTHEMGHALGLGHSADSTATMYAIAHFDGRCASIKQDDANGIAFIYPGVGGGPGPLSIVTATLPAGTVGGAYSQTMAASGGTAPYHWSVLAGSGALPPGLSLSDSGALSGSPTTAGTYNFTIRVTDTGSGSAQKAFSVVVGAAGTAYDSQFVSQTVSTTLTPGQTFVANLVWLNTGTQTWDGPSGALRLVSQNPLNNTTWGGNTVMLTPFTVAAGQQLNVSFQAIAPTAPGTYNFQWRLARDATSLFGQMSANVSITVGSGGGGGGGGGGTNGASFVSQSVPAAMTAGQPAAVSVTMSNTGSTTWSPGSYVLTSLNPAGNTTWGPGQVALASSVPPGSSATFNFNVTAPAAAGTYNFQWGMAQSGVGPFGSPSTNVPVSVSPSGGGGGSNNSQFMTQSAPATWVPGQTYSVSVSMKNTGTTTWTTASYKLGSQSPANNTSWGPSRVSLSKNVPPGSMGVFTFNVTAPTAPGTYNFQWQVIQEGVGFFGALTPNIPLANGGGGGGTNGASFVSQSVPAAMTAGQPAAVSVTMSNTGSTTWSPGSYVLTSLNPAGNTTWGPGQVALASSVPPGSSATFNFNVTAPAAAGTYNFQWGMAQSSVGPFGSPSTNVPVSVSPSGGGINNAQFASQTVPASITAGGAATVTITMLNTGTTTWDGGYLLRSQNPAGSMTWGLIGSGVQSPVPPGSSATFTFNIQAPLTPGTYNFQWQMSQSTTGAYFGTMTPNVAIIVSSGSVDPLMITTTSLPFGQAFQAYSAQVTATGGEPAYSWSLSSGSLPAGLTLNPATGRISGTPTVSGTFNVTVIVRDTGGRSASRLYKMFFR